MLTYRYDASPRVKRDVARRLVGTADDAVAEIRPRGRRPVVISERAELCRDKCMLVDELPTLIATGQVTVELGKLVRLECIEGVTSRLLVPVLVAGHAFRPGSSSPRSSTALSCNRSRFIAASVRLFTVPSGRPVRSAISRCE